MSKEYFLKKVLTSAVLVAYDDPNVTEITTLQAMTHKGSLIIEWSLQCLIIGKM